MTSMCQKQRVHKVGECRAFRGGSENGVELYDDFGRTISRSGSMADFFRMRFSTKYFESETGLYYYGYRFYSPALMRWLNRDPIEENGGMNLYGFCGNNAMWRFDKDGRAYFAYRPLDNPVTLRIGIIAMSSDFMKKRNWVVAHEQLIFEDGGTPKPYKLATREGRATGQYNCQDYADDLRHEYYRLLLDIKIRCKCNLK